MKKMTIKIGLLVKRNALIRRIKRKSKSFIRSMIKLIQIAIILGIRSKLMMIMEIIQL